MKNNATVNIAIILGIRRGEFVEIILVNFPAESLTEVENRPSISPCTPINFLQHGRKLTP